MKSQSPILEIDLHRYIDEPGDAARNARIAAYLDENPETAMRVRDWQEQTIALRQLFPVVRPVRERAESSHSAKLSQEARLSRRLNLALAFLLGISLAVIIGGASTLIGGNSSAIRDTVHSISFRGW